MNARRHDRHTALAFATRAHARQVGHDGRPHHEHVARVVANAETLLAGLPAGTFTAEEEDEILQGAALHDCPEDESHTGVTHGSLEAEGFPPLARAIALRLDGRRRPGTYMENIAAIATEGDLAVIVVKLADVMDNGSPARRASLPPELAGLSRRYDRALAVLRPAYEAFLSPSPRP